MLDGVGPEGEKTVVLGATHDNGLRVALRVALRGARTARESSWHGLGGSQWVERLEARFPCGRRVVVEAETYVGLSVSGPADLVDRIKSTLRARSQRWSWLRRLLRR